MYRTVTAGRLVNDPWPQGGFFGNVFRAVTGVVGGAIKGIIATKSPVGGIVGAVGGAIGATKANIAADQAVATSAPLVSTLAPIPVLQMTPVAPGGGIITQSPLGTPVSAAAIQRQIAAQQSAAKGTHMNKQWSYSRKTGQLAAPGTKLVSNRRMNWANGRALGRAERRIKSAVNHMTKYIRWVHPGRAGHAAPKFRKKAR